MTSDIISINDTGGRLVEIQDGKPVTTSLRVSEKFVKPHKNVLRDIKDLDIPQDFRASNFEPSNYLTSQGKKMPFYILTEPAFTLLVMGWTGKTAMKFKIEYIQEFERMRYALQSMNNTILDRMDNLQATVDEIRRKLADPNRPTAPTLLPNQKKIEYTPPNTKVSRVLDIVSEYPNGIHVRQIYAEFGCEGDSAEEAIVRATAYKLYLKGALSKPGFGKYAPAKSQHKN